MDLIQLVQGLPKLFSNAQTIRAIWNGTTTNEGFTEKLVQTLPAIADLLAGLGGIAFPEAAPALRTVAGFVKAFDPDRTKWLQGTLNNILPGMGWTKPLLDVDGDYGPRTEEAVKFVQQHLGLTVDGLAGNVTEDALKAFLDRGKK